MKLDLFRKKEKTKDDELSQAPIQNQPNIYQEQIRTLVDTVSNLSKSIKNIEGKIYEFSEKIVGVEEKTKVYENEILNLKNNIEKMIGIYDLLYKQYNPFLEEEKGNLSPEIQETANEMTTTGVLPLDRIDNDPAVIAIIIGWLSYLVRKAGIRETEKTLEFYERVRWITEEVKIKLMEYLKGLENVESKNEKIGPEDHVLTLYIISKIKGGEYKNLYRIKDLYNELVQRGILKPNEV
ncbi:hypothetical protein BA065_02355 [Nanoarchaeota archaeon NZ13-N]|uniref:Archaeal flagella protein FlaD/E domain-containing protein n=1 Tax=Candidatus Nanoclepta minutus TaxID=1940235 RepID=A0A397WP65_9ARCH|nr:MAG: hypothetical protein BA065_02355 [Nanoarchaeota archaeon NZ13-N]RIB35691.1 MAG: hypothetical protein BXU00_01170 [Candidatus Nanoclepta minutus]